MKNITIEKLSKTDYDLRFFNFLEHFWLTYTNFNCFNKPKKYDLLIFLNDCDAVYTTKDGQRIYAKSGDVVYTPMNSEYNVNFCNFKHEKSSTLQINFFVFNSDGEQIKLSDGQVQIFTPLVPLAVKELFQKLKLLSLDARTLPTQNKVVLFEILNSLGCEKTLDKTSPLISAGIEYLHLHYLENPSITTLASECHISEEYFRRLFKKQMGVSPSEYRNRLRLNKAKEYLKYGDISVQEISENLCYATVSHFIKQFKAEFGLSPLQFRLNG